MNSRSFSPGDIVAGKYNDLLYRVLSTFDYGESYNVVYVNSRTGVAEDEFTYNARLHDAFRSLNKDEKELVAKWKKSPIYMEEVNDMVSQMIKVVDRYHNFSSSTEEDGLLDDLRNALEKFFKYPNYRSYN